MDMTTLGRTGLTVSRFGLGAGGSARLGTKAADGERGAVALVQAAMDAGINLIDTAEVYGSEEVVGKAIAGKRDTVVLSSKKFPRDLTAASIRKGCEAALKRLQTDYLDIYHLHGLRPDAYDEVCETALPTLHALRDEGKIRFLGVTELFENDTDHKMLQRALTDDFFDVVMVGFNLLNPSARHRVFPLTQAKNVGVLVMFAVRTALSRPVRLAEILGELAERGEIPAEINLDFLGAAGAVTDSGYRFCRHEPGVDVVLGGTSRIDHLHANLESVARGPLPAGTREELKRLFGSVESVSGS